MKITKSWIITISSFIFAIAAPPLADAGILISEDQITHYMMMFFGVSGIGAGMSVKKEIQKKREAAAPPPPPAPAAPAPEVNQPRNSGTGEFVPMIEPVYETVPAPEPEQKMPPAPAAYNTGMPQKPLATDQADNPTYTGHDNDWFHTDLEYEKEVGAVVRQGDPFLWIRVKDAAHIKGRIEHKKNVIQFEQGAQDLRFELYTKKDGVITQWENGEYEFFFSAWVNQQYKQGSGKFTVID